MTNDRLRAAIASSPDTIETLSSRVGLDPKTIERWISKGRLPHRGNRMRVARALGADELYLWPEAMTESRLQSTTAAEVIGQYANRGSVPIDTWRQMIRASSEEMSLLAYSASFLHDTMPDFDDLLVERAAAGLKVRLLFGDPSSQAVAIRGEEEQIGSSLTERCRLNWKYLAPILDTPGIDARRHGCTLYASLFRFDDDLLANHHLFGAPANHSPVTHLHRVEGGRLFDVHMASFERVWALGTPTTREHLA